MIATGFHEPKKLSRFHLDLRRRITAHVEESKSLEELSQEADELWVLHHAGTPKPVS